MIRLKNLITESQPPQDKIINIDGSLPYVTVVYQENPGAEGMAHRVSIDFEDYELTDRVDDYAWHGYLTGVDQNGEEWAVDAEAVTIGGGDYDWYVDWDTIEKK